MTNPRAPAAPAVVAASDRTGSDRTAADRAVHALYDAYPYPAGAPTLRVEYDVRQVLSRLRLSRGESGAHSRPLRVLDAGCGRGVGLLAEASVQPDIEYLGIDLNTRALAEVDEQARARGLSNVRTAEVDLVTLEGLEVPEGGFDVIRSSGVIHHLDDPTAALERLASTALAPHGAVTLMVYARAGRARITRVARAVQAATDSELPLAERVEHARALCRAVADVASLDCPFADAARCPDAEFVDRYLHPRERTYDVVELVEMVTDAGLVPVQLSDGERWSPAAHIDDPAVLARVEARPALEQLVAVEALAPPDRHEALLCAPGNGPRPPLSAPEALGAPLLVNGHVRFRVDTRVAPSGLRVERVAIARRDGEPTPLPVGPVTLAAWLLSTTTGPFAGRDVVAGLTERGVPEEAARRALGELLGAGVVYSPHACDLPAHD